MKLSPALRDFLAKHSDLINNNNFEKLYLEAFFNEPRIEAHELTWVLIRSDIDFLSHMTEIPHHCFEGLYINSIFIPPSIREISYNAFTDCKSLINVEISDGVEDIWHDAFSSCTALKRIILPDSVKNIRDGIFSDCISLESVSIGKNIHILPEGAFWGCESLSHIDIPTNIIGIAPNAFSESGLETLKVPPSVRKLNNIVTGCQKLREIYIPNFERPADFATYQFRKCPQLTDIYFEGTEEDWRGLVLYPGEIRKSIKIHFNVKY